MTTALLARATVAGSLALAAVLAAVSVLLMPDFSGGHADRLAAIAAAPGTATVSALGFTLSQLFLAGGVVGLAHLLADRTPVLAWTGAVLVVLGCFGHAVYGGVSATMLSMAQDLSAVDVHAGVLARTEQGAGLPFMAAGLLGTVLGLLVLAVSLWRGHVGPRWVGPAIVLWVVVEFVGSGFSQWTGYAGGLLYVAVFVALAVEVWRSAPEHWRTAARATSVERPTVSA
ncbi:hypothetical protein [Ornithinimicrobium avium]|uniref:DUF4386 family protein n=1 Tax=Ornithinimicrobium avium TaxID=2283195 RepID=A0A345NKR1_9MICO|nr:hypothetical protein [Ornithinimicrobium avium]AXH95619.1 hypothetical protein DV701_05355 [Ornithinimicrobium avium]